MNSFLRKIKRHAFVCAGMAALMSLSPWNNTTMSKPIRINAETGEIETDSKYEYVSDLKLGIDPTEQGAIKQLEDAGYTVSKNNLNKGASRYVYLGYKTSNNMVDAITSVKGLTMETGYQELNYRDFLSENAKGLPATVAGFQSAVAKMKENYLNQEPLAVYAHDNLNLLCVPASTSELTGPGLGDYLIDNYKNYSLMEDMFLILQPTTLTFINDQLAIACCDNYVNEDDSEYLSSWESNEYFFDEIAIKMEAIYNEIVYGGNAEYDEMELVSKNAITIDSMLSDDHFADVINEEVRDTLLKTRTSFYMNSTSYTDLYHILISDNKFLQACFVEALPYTMDRVNFFYFANDYVKDSEKKVPSEIPNLPEVISPVFGDVASYMNDFKGNPYNYEQSQLLVDEYGGPVEELEFFIQLVDNFLTEYYDQLAKAQDILEDYNGDLSLIEVLQKLSARNEEMAKEGEQDKAYHDAFFYLMPVEVLKGYKFKDNHNLINMYGERVTDLFGLLEYMIDAYYCDDEECVSYSIASFFLRFMGEEDLYVLKTSSFPVYTLTASIDPDKNSEIRKQFDENKQTIVDAYKSLGFEEDECSVWFGTNKDLLEESLVCQTDSTIRQKIIDEDFKNALLKVQDDKLFKEKLSDALEKVGLALAVIGVVMAVGQAVAMSFVAAGTGFFALMQMGAFSMVGLGSTFGLAAAGAVAAAITFISTVLFVLVFIALIILLILLLTMDPPEPEPEEPERVSIPKIMIDCEKANNGDVKKAIRYDLIEAVDGNDADINGYRLVDDHIITTEERETYKKKSWNALYYSKSTEFGSPLIVKDGEVFRLTTPNSLGPDDSLPVSPFGQPSAFDLNMNHPDSDVNAYLHYWTVASTHGEVPEEERQGKYLERLVMATSTRKEVAVNALKLKGEEYTIIDVDVTRDIEDYTYLAYKTTNNEKEAVTDIRAAFGTSSYNFSWGDSSNPYICVYDASEVSCPIKTPHDSRIEGAEDGDDSVIYWNLYCSYSRNVGDPILASSLSIIGSLDELGDGYEYARWFSGGAFDFSVQKEDSDYFYRHCFLQYTTEEQYRHYKDEPEYLAGFVFVSYSSSWIPSGSKSLSTYAKDIGCQPVEFDLTRGLLHDSSDITYLTYAKTNNPKKAVTDIGTFTSEAQTSGMLLDNIVQNSTSFESCLTVYAGDKDYAATSAYDKERMCRNSHAFITSISSEANFCQNAPFKDNYGVRPKGLYCAGPQEGVNPILLSDLVSTTKAFTTPSSTGNNSDFCHLNTQQKVDGPLGTGWKSVHALDNYFYDEYDAGGDLLTPGSNLGVSRDEKQTYDVIFHLFFKNGTPNKVRGKYVRSLELVGKYDQEEDKDILNEARYMAMGAGEEIINLEEPFDRDYFYNLRNDNVLYKGVDYSTYGQRYQGSGTFAVASYTDSKTSAIGGAICAYNSPTTLRISYDYSPEPYVYTQGRYNNGWPLKNSIYTTRSGDPINRVALSEHDGTRLRNVNTKGGTVSYVSTVAKMMYKFGVVHNDSKVITCYLGLLSYNVPEYISDIKFFCDYEGHDKYYYFTTNHYQSGFITSMNGKGYKEYISSDLGIGQDRSKNNRLIATISRTNDPAKALKDIQIYFRDMGPEITINGRVYKRLNSHTAVDYAQFPVYFYATIGNSIEQNKNPRYPNYAERVAITNFGYDYDFLEDDRADYITWSGQTGTKARGDYLPGGNSSANKMIYVKGQNNSVLYSLVPDTYFFLLIEDYANNSFWVDYYPVTLRPFITTHSGKSLYDYEKGVNSGVLTGSKKGDNALGLGSAVSKSPFFLITMGVGLTAIGVAAGFFIGRKNRKKEGSLEDEEN